jgi:DNA-binding transcriptional ArsR family regulator/uncharacterized protein YndB with AHSA1/START domain
VSSVSEQFQQLMDALNSPIRREILWIIGDGELAAGDISGRFEVAMPTISRHLAVLREAGLIERRVDGNFRRYRVRRDRLQGLENLLGDSGRWTNAADVPERQLATGHGAFGILVETTVPTDPGTAFRDFTEERRYSRWIGVPVSLREGRYRMKLEWGTTIRGNYVTTVADRLVVMDWQFDDDAVPVPSDERLRTYLWFTKVGDTTRLTVEQVVLEERAQRYLSEAWRTMLGRYRQSFDEAPTRRRSRPKGPA